MRSRHDGVVRGHAAAVDGTCLHGASAGNPVARVEYRNLARVSFCSERCEVKTISLTTDTQLCECANLSLTLVGVHQQG